jgi:hypothetical protein
MTSYVFLGAIEDIAAEGYLSEKEIKKLTRIKKRRMKDAIQELKSEIERLRK